MKESGWALSKGDTFRSKEMSLRRELFDVVLLREIMGPENHRLSLQRVRVEPQGSVI